MSETVPETHAVTGAITKKLGPLPGWAWLLIVVGGAYAYHWYKNRSAGISTGSSVASLPASPGSYGGSTTDTAGGTGYGGIVPSGSGSVSVTPYGAASPTTNAQWARTTADSMIAAGGNPTDTTNALTAYLNGQSLNATQQAIVNQALSHYGSPPEGLIAVGGSPSFVSFLRDSLNGAIYGVSADGTRSWLTPEQYAAAGSPAPTATVQNAYKSYARDSTTGSIYGITGTGDRVWLSAAEYAALGKPAYTSFSGAGNAPAPSAPAAAHKYTVQSGDTIGSVSQKFYGTSDTSVISKANPGAVFTPGTVISIP